MSTENCTYFESEGVREGGCEVEICPCNNNICQVVANWNIRFSLLCKIIDKYCILQLRLDFDTFVISGPSTSTQTVTYRRPNGGGTTVNAGGTAGVQETAKNPMTEFTQCLTDSFSVTNPSGINPPVICGTNSGEHSK